MSRSKEKRELKDETYLKEHDFCIAKLKMDPILFGITKIYTKLELAANKLLSYFVKLLDKMQIYCKGDL